MFRRRGATNRGNALSVLFAAIALGVIGTGWFLLIRSEPASWTHVIATIAGVVICAPFAIHVGRSAGYPLVGVGVVILAIPPVPESAVLGVSVWALGVAISLLVLRRSPLHALSVTGTSIVGAFAFVAVHGALSALGVWQLPAFVAAAAAYYLLFLLGECARQWPRSTPDHGFSLSSISFPRVALVVLGIGVIATLMNYVNSSLIPWFEHNPAASRRSFVVLLTASLLYVLAQRQRYTAIEHRLNALIDAAVELPRETGRGIADALQERARDIVRANAVELREAPPEAHEIGAPVSLESGDQRHLVAERKIGGGPFTREDQHALVTLAHVASEAARVQSEVDVLERRANSDTLTGLPNYGAFQKALVEANEHRPYHEGIALLFIDLDNFKKLNDNFGHRAGDELLCAIAERLQSSAGGGDFVSRVGGDEFVVILTGLVSLEQAKESADRIIEKINQPLSLEGRYMRPIVSAGLAFSSHRELDAQTLVEDADRTMLQVKRSRRQGGHLEESSVSVSLHRSTRTNDIVARAIRGNRLSLAFQPIVSIERGSIWAFEALVRYVDPELGPISPPSLVARAKSLGLMNELTQQVITKALEAAEQFRRLEPDIDCMTVNIELGQISEAELGPFIRAAAAAHPDIRLCIELNERSLRSVTDDLRRDAEAMQEAGVIIALDDYGSDDSPVGALVRFPMNILKIDKSLISDLEDVRQREVIRALQGFGDNLQHTVVVEGIENRAMADVLVELGVRDAQGYYFGRPLPLAQTLDRIRRSSTQATLRR
ncbi:EAL domain-containing protein [Leucobacter triazinivorans]|uniref:EAL domain-containing protein n=1 Tax=Leucobacter triazinivorans TaxID=1784719 RepID=A0A4P6KBH9_9MICO|nr:EAL domain-containing protein [Leucobacter triazinivorans]QBE47636.1 EAL domain-containing protein [Leucobacter triazinivorans]